MRFFSNKHVIAAFIVAPILAVLSYMMVDLFVRETPHSAVEGASYPLAPQSNCRYTSGQCDLKNNDFFVRLSVLEQDGHYWLTLSSDFSLQGAIVAFQRKRADGTQDIDVAPSQMSFNEPSGRWQIRLPTRPDENTFMMIVMQSNNTQYYADTSMAFSNYETSFDKTF